ncbi:MAG: hypothetical protein ABI807_01660 [Sporichthyaceae bacterium]
MDATSSAFWTRSGPSCGNGAAVYLRAIGSSHASGMSDASSVVTLRAALLDNDSVDQGWFRMLATVSESGREPGDRPAVAGLVVGLPRWAWLLQTTATAGHATRSRTGFTARHSGTR